MNLKERAEKFKTDIPAIVLALKAKETPLIAKILATMAITYALSPIDIIPDFIPIIGYLDDVILLLSFIAMTIKLIPVEVFEQCRLQAKQTQEDDTQRKWYYALPIIFIWLLIIWLIIKAIWL